MANESAFQRPTLIDRTFNRLFGLLIRFGLGLPHNYLLQVEGRASGRLYSTPVDVLMYRDRLFLVAARGRTQWALNAQARGRVILKKGAIQEPFLVRAVPDEKKPELLQAYLNRFKSTVQRFFPVPAGSPARDFVPLVGRYPIFELIPVS